MVVKENQPALHWDLEQVFADPVLVAATGPSAGSEDLLGPCRHSGRRVAACCDPTQATAIPQPVLGDCTSARTFTKGHGRLEVRRLWTSTALVGYSDWPGLAQALCQEREVIRLNTGEVRRERAYAVTSLHPEQADAVALLRLWRGHWSIENRLHGVRDVGFGEDRSAARAGSVPQGLAALRNTVIGLLRAHGHATIAATRRALAYQAEAAVTLLGL